MTKTQIERLAECFRKDAPKMSYAARQGYHWAIKDFATVMVATRKGFDRARFLKDCGVTP